jgi:hypothetical protein
LRRIDSLRTLPTALAVVTETVTTAPTRRRLWRNIRVSDTEPFEEVVNVRDFGQPLCLLLQVTRTCALAGASVTRRDVNRVDFEVERASKATSAETRPAASAPEQSWSSPSPPGSACR